MKIDYFCAHLYYTARGIICKEEIGKYRVERVSVEVSIGDQSVMALFECLLPCGSEEREISVLKVW